MQFNPLNFIENLKYMANGMLGIAIVICVIIGVTVLLSYRKKK